MRNQVNAYSLPAGRLPINSLSSFAYFASFAVRSFSVFFEREGSKSIEGIYQNGKIELLETPDLLEGAKVIVTFVSKDNFIDLPSRGINPEQAANLRARLQCFADWENPDMGAYDAL
ncbi:antitoxin family protein [Dulcicalothrix desertica]|uniref:antitoxin family protein n=1 Tax=Dulcicalothrix desertica TaxID=32056 RepID=UPI001F27BD61|nr:antitoxin AF2212-like protein [Dulcicalothrix desertica]